MKRDSAGRNIENQPLKKAAIYNDPGVMLIVLYFIIIFFAFVLGSAITSRARANPAPDQQIQRVVPQAQKAPLPHGA